MDTAAADEAMRLVPLLWCDRPLPRAAPLPLPRVAALPPPRALPLDVFESADLSVLAALPPGAIVLDGSAELGDGPVDAVVLVNFDC